MEKIPIFGYIPPVKFYDELKIDESMIIDKFIGVMERVGVMERPYGSSSPMDGLYNNGIGFCPWMSEMIKSEDVEAMYIFGSSVYRMDNPDDITDVDMFIARRRGIEIQVPRELREKGLHVQMLSLSGVCFTYEIHGLSHQLLVLKTSENAEKVIEQARKIFNEDYLFAVILRDVYKVCATKKISDITDDALKEKIMKMRLIQKIEDEESPYFVRTALKEWNRVDENELSTLLDFSFKRRRVKKEYRKMIENKTQKFWKTGLWE